MLISSKEKEKLKTLTRMRKPFEFLQLFLDRKPARFFFSEVHKRPGGTNLSLFPPFPIAIPRFAFQESEDEEVEIATLSE
jgi:hypothetical protein